MSQRVLQMAGAAVQALIEDTDVPVMIDFGASWCVPCRQQRPVIRQVARRMGTRAKICEVDIDRERAMAVRLNIHSIPTLIIFAAAVERERFIGVQSAETLITALNRWADRPGRPRTDTPEV